jgi:hypothetical protein
MVIIYLSVNTILGLIVYPFTDEQLVLIVVEVRALSFSLIVDPVTFEVVSVSLRQNTVTITLSLVPLTFINIFVGVNHTTLALGHTIDPVTVVTVSILVEEGASAVLLILEPITGVLTSELLGLHTPVGTLTMTLIKAPHAFILVTRLIVLNTEALLAVIAPVAHVLGTADPFVSLNGAILTRLTLLNPEDSSVGSIFLSFCVIATKRYNKYYFTFSRNE